MEIQITFRKVNPTPEIEAQIIKEARKVERICPRQLAFCHVVVEDRHRQVGRRYRARVTLQGPAGYFVASSEPGAGFSHYRLHVAITRAFQAIRYQLLTKAHPRNGDLRRDHLPSGQEVWPGS